MDGWPKRFEVLKPTEIPKYAALALYGLAKAAYHLSMRYQHEPLHISDHFQHPLDQPYPGETPDMQELLLRTHNVAIRSENGS